MAIKCKSNRWFKGFLFLDIENPFVKIDTIAVIFSEEFTYIMNKRQVR
jgi:hypothetical protein